MKKYLLILFIILSLLFLSLEFNNNTEPNDLERKLSAISKHANIIESIMPEDTFYYDLAFLKGLLKGKEIVLLGEATHQDGATFLAKSRLIRFLHKELGFNVVIYETGFYDTFNMWEKIKNSKPPNRQFFSEAFYNFWYDNAETAYLTQYILSNVNTRNELEIAGLDVQFSGQVGRNVRASRLNEYLNSKPEINIKAFPAFFSINQSYNSCVIPWISKSLSPAKKDSILKEIKSIESLLEHNRPQNKSDSVYLRFFKNLYVLYDYTWNYQLGSDKRFHIRDSAMAENFIWLKDNCFNNKNVIIWAANLHTSYDNSSYNPDPSPFTSMGEYIKKKYGSLCYSINFTSFSNSSRLGSRDETYNNKTVEFLMHKTGQPYLFLDFNKIDTSSFLKKSIIMNCNQNLSFNAYWSKITDAVFFIDNMTEPHKLK